MKNSFKDFEFETFEKYVGGPEEVKNFIENCPNCSCKLTFSHYPDSCALMVEETARCFSCDYGQRKIIHVLN